MKNVLCCDLKAHKLGIGEVNLKMNTCKRVTVGGLTDKTTKEKIIFIVKSTGWLLHFEVLDLGIPSS